MERRSFVKALPVLPVLTGAAFVQDSSAQQAAGQSATTASGSGAKAYSGDVTKYAGGMQHSDGSVVDTEGKPQQGFKDRGSANGQADPKVPFQMKLTKEEQDIMDGKKGPEF